MSDSSATREQDFCYRHPDRRSYILCQRCHRTICPECSVDASVGVHCVECVRDAQKAARKNQPGPLTKLQRWFNFSETPVTISLIVGMFIIWGLQFLIPGFTEAFWYSPMYTEFWLTQLGVPFEPWRMLTANFLHSTSGIFHILLNMFSLYILGQNLERMFGKSRFLVLTLVSGFGGSLAVQLFAEMNTAVVGASGAIFGMLGAYFAISRKLTGKINQSLIVILGLNLVAGFVLPGISWQSHVGGLLVGAAVAYCFLKWGRQGGSKKEKLAVMTLSIVLVLISLAAAAILWPFNPYA
ncbi:MAG: rhomboid family intramembrane serine protease [Microbacteriaceae bacterium]